LQECYTVESKIHHRDTEVTEKASAKNKSKIHHRGTEAQRKLRAKDKSSPPALRSGGARDDKSLVRDWYEVPRKIAVPIPAKPPLKAVRRSGLVMTNLN